MAPLQKRALYSFLTGLVLAIAFCIVMIIQGDVTAFDRNAGLRYVMYAVLIGVPLVYGVFCDLTLRGPTRIDERDRRIIEKSGRIQWMAVVFALAGWTIALAEIYRDSRQVPMAFLTLIFVTALIVSPLAQSLGILLGYRRLDRDG